MASDILGLIAHKRSGKDTFAHTLVGAGYTRVAFADPIRTVLYETDPVVDWEACDDGYNVNVYQLTEAIDYGGWEHSKEINPEIRRLMQNLGMAIREIDPDFWLREALRTIDNIPGPVVVTDVRFANEANALRRMGAKMVRITRPGYDGDAHVSEHELDGYPVDLTVANDGTIADLEDKAHRVVASLTR